MVWLIFTGVSLVSAIVTEVTGSPIGVYVTLYTVSVLWLIVSACVILISISSQRIDYLALGGISSDLGSGSSILRALERERDTMTERLLKHESDIVKSLGISAETAGAGEKSILSHNLLAQLPDLSAIPNVISLVSKVQIARNNVLCKMRDYNEKVTNIQDRQGNPLIYSMFIPTYDVSFIDTDFEK